MKSRLYLFSDTNLSLYSPDKTEFILALAPFSRQAIDLNESLIKEAKQRGFELHLEWDALMEEPRFRTITPLLEDQWLSSIRVKDAGAARWVRDHTKQRIWLHAEAGHHNLSAIESWKLRLGDRLQGVILSNELPQKKIQTWCSSLNLQTELLVLGPLLLFHSPRKLLSPLQDEDSAETIHALGASVESPHKGFPLVENDHGTFMFHPKDLGLIDRFDEIVDSKIDFYRIDERTQKGATKNIVAQFVSKPNQGKAMEIKNLWNKDWLRGYWNTNKSDVLFDKLTNPHLQKTQEVVAEVIDVKKSHWLAIKVISTHLNLQTPIEVVTPLGKSKRAQIVWIKNSHFKEVQELKAGEIGFIPWVSGTPSRSIIRFVRER